jgi:hypothetical protein
MGDTMDAVSDFGPGGIFGKTDRRNAIILRIPSDTAIIGTEDTHSRDRHPLSIAIDLDTMSTQTAETGFPLVSCPMLIESRHRLPGNTVIVRGEQTGLGNARPETAVLAVKGPDLIHLAFAVLGPGWRRLCLLPVDQVEAAMYPDSEPVAAHGCQVGSILGRSERGHLPSREERTGDVPRTRAFIQ